jgi:hypothetical protein
VSPCGACELGGMVGGVRKAAVDCGWLTEEETDGAAAHATELVSDSLRERRHNTETVVGRSSVVTTSGWWHDGIGLCVGMKRAERVR